MNGIKRIQDLGTLVLGTAFALDYAQYHEIAESMMSKYEFEHATVRGLRHFAIGLRQLADAVDEQAVLVAEALAEIECATPTAKETLDRNRTLLRGDSVDIEGL